MHHFRKVVALLPPNHAVVGSAADLVLDGFGLRRLARSAKFAFELIEQGGHMIVKLGEREMRSMLERSVFLYAPPPVHQNRIAPF